MVQDAKGKSAIKKKKAAVPMVGLGASAGGLESLTSFFDALPDDSGAAFVVVSHLAPKHVSLLPELLQRHTTMPVVQISDGTQAVANHIYIISPNHNLLVLHGALHLLEIDRSKGLNLPIDGFFKSLAQDQGQHSVGIILSGTGFDGLQGCKAIKAAYGMVIAQSESSAKYDGMPHAIIVAGLADYVLKPEQMPKKIHEHLTAKSHSQTTSVSRNDEPESAWLQKIFVLLRARTNHDFSSYKTNTLMRRIERRMSVHHLETVADYVSYLQKSAHEAEILFSELLIGVTHMFRDPEAFEALQKLGIIKMLQHKPAGYTFRVWVAGCSTGEEAYAIGMLFLESFQANNQAYQLQIFATDIDEKAIAVARWGIYPASIEANVSQARLQRFFTKLSDGSYQTKKALRDTMVFATQNIISDPPFTKLDVLTCRNLLIYFNADLQQKLLPIFHYSLKPGGILFLGSSETIGHQLTSAFLALDKKSKIFESLAHSSIKRPIISFPMATKREKDLEDTLPNNINNTEEISAFQLVEAILQQSDAPPCVIINKNNDITYVHGKTGRFLEQAEGQVSLNILSMVRTGLKKALADAIHQVALHKQPIHCKNLKVRLDGGYLGVDMLVKPIVEPVAILGMMMVVFQAASIAESEQASSSAANKTPDELEQELSFTKEHLQSTIEELQASNEELKSTNEELQSTNEELQSTNEELETSKEEMQSLHEESVVVNAELQGRVDDLSLAQGDMNNLLDSTKIAVVFLDADLCIRRFTPAVTSLIPLLPTDVGRPLRHFVTNFQHIDITRDAEKVLNDLSTLNRDVVSKDGLNYQMLMRPYRTVNNVIDGVVLTFSDVSASKQSEKKAISAKAFAEDIVNTVREPLLVLDTQFRIVTANTAFYNNFSVKPKDAVGQSIFSVADKQWDIESFRKLLVEVIPQKKAFEDYTFSHHFKGLGLRTIILNARQIKSTDNEELILLSIAYEENKGG